MPKTRATSPASWLRFAPAALIAGMTPAQCQFTALTSQPIGTFCNMGSTGCCAIAGGPTQLEAQLDVTNCSLGLTVRAIEGCCGVTIPLRVVAIGTTLANVPLPQFGIGCTLWLQPTDFFVLSGATTALPIPPALPPLTFLAQGAAVVVDPFQLPALVTLTSAQAITLQ